MPCRDYDTADNLKVLKARLDRATQVACDIAKLLRRLSLMKGGLSYENLLSQETREWIIEHEVLDRTRGK